MAYVGIDVGSDRIHCVAVDGSGHVVEVGLFGAADLAVAVEWAAGATTVAIDAPAALSTAPHGDEVGRRSAKFRFARCAEIDLSERLGIWVPWVTPRSLESCRPWMQVGLRLFEAFAAAGQSAIEVYPHGAFSILSGTPLPKKTTPAGILARAAVLERPGTDDRHLRLWSHDSLDAAISAVVARDHAEGRARPAGCGHDASTIWLPAA
jgi:predicted nuclease with RNAse H fold